MLLPQSDYSQTSISYSIQRNRFGDLLPVIPSDSKVQHHSVLFRLDIEITVTKLSTPVPNLRIPFVVSGTYSHAKMLSATNGMGKAILRLETRTSGKNSITTQIPGTGRSEFIVDIQQAWYDATFKITAYNCCDEDDFSGKLVTDKNVGARKEDFLFGGGGVCMQGTGVGSDGKFIQVSNPKSVQWNPGYAGVSNTSAAIFVYRDAVHGAYSIVTANQSIAIDPSILPPRHRVDIQGPRALGERRGDDTGGAIKGHHFDNYAGAGKAAIKAWNAAGGNIDAAKVKYLGK